MMDELKARIDAAITTMRKWPNLVNVDNEYYGVYFYKKEIFVIHDTDMSIYELPIEIVEKIAIELEAGRFEVSKEFQG